MGNFKEDIARVKAFVFDVDGVFTDGGIMPLREAHLLFYPSFAAPREHQ